MGLSWSMRITHVLRMRGGQNTIRVGNQVKILRAGHENTHFLRAGRGQSTISVGQAGQKTRTRTL
ncbi:hypothetical protein C8R48DRAFT_701918 [Suillus tomentosus]|nr:hypothetical protein C8R48DRAFT_701918 [Suillus tomentosus]